MPVKQGPTFTLFIFWILLAMAPGGPAAAQDTTNLQFQQPPSTGSAEERSIQSLVKIQGPGQFREDGLFSLGEADHNPNAA